MARQKQHIIEREGSEDPYSVQIRYLKALRECCKKSNGEGELRKAADDINVPYHYIYAMRREYPEFEQSIINIMGAYCLKMAESIMKVIMKTQVNVDNPNPQILIKMLERFDRLSEKYMPDVSHFQDDAQFEITEDNESSG